MMAVLKLPKEGFAGVPPPLQRFQDSKTRDGTGTGEYESYLYLLRRNTEYFVRAYATNSAGTAYGDEEKFKTKK